MAAEASFPPRFHGVTRGIMGIIAPQALRPNATPEGRGERLTSPVERFKFAARTQRLEGGLDASCSSG